MGKVIALIKIMPDGVKSDDELRALMQSVKNTVKPPVELTRMDAKDIAFGLRAVTATIILEDGVGGPEPICDALAKIPGVESVEVTDMGRI
ncbi:MAG: elongation factor 1-beta [Candidatus Thermoplasmatota archaeon]|nr:elongation factor 1-beta [Candidatus Thermoplasmatota archaeon]